MRLNSDIIRNALQKAAKERLATLEVFAEIESTNTYLMQKQGPTPGQIEVAVTDNQTAGRGRQGRTWQSPAGSGLCLSLAYTFASSPANLSALTLAIGIGAIESLQRLQVDGIQLKWPNDLIARNGKLGGILTEAQTRSDGSVTIVTGVGLNIDLSGHPDLVLSRDSAPRIMDLKTLVALLPARNAIASGLVDGLTETLVEYETSGFGPFTARWKQYDWLRGRELTIAAPQHRISGTGAGVAADGALLVDTGPAGEQRISSGTVLIADDMRMHS